MPQSPETNEPLKQDTPEGEAMRNSNEELRTFREELKQARDAEEDVFRQLAMVNARNVDPENQRADAGAQRAEVDAKLAELNAQLAEAKKASAAGVAEAAKALQDMDVRLTAEIAESADQFAKLKRRYQERLADIAELGHAVVDLETQLRRITAQHAHARLSQHILNMLKSAHNQLHAALSKLRYSRDHRRAASRVSMDSGLIKASGLFDAEWYLEMYPDVAESGIAPIRHLVLHGAYELRDPGPNFSAFKYHRAYPDVTEAGVPAILHFLRHGKAEGRRASKVGEGA